MVKLKPGNSIALHRVQCGWTTCCRHKGSKSFYTDIPDNLQENSNAFVSLGWILPSVCPSIYWHLIFAIFLGFPLAKASFVKTNIPKPGSLEIIAILVCDHSSAFPALFLLDKILRWLPWMEGEVQVEHWLHQQGRGHNFDSRRTASCMWIFVANLPQDCWLIQVMNN